MAVDLVFEHGPAEGPPYDLIFGDDTGGPVPDRTFTLVAELPAISVSGTTRVVERFSVAAALPALVVLGHQTYDSNTARPTVCERKAPHEDAQVLRTVVHEPTWHEGQAAPQEVQAVHENAQILLAQVEAPYTDADRVARPVDSRHQNAQGLGGPTTTAAHQDGLRDHRTLADSRHQNAQSLGNTSRTARHQDGLRDRRNFTAAPWQAGLPYSRELDGGFQKAMQFLQGWGTRYQSAWPPRPGRTLPPVVPGADPCYVPPSAHAVALLFDAPRSSVTNLLFVCETHPDPGPGPVETVVVPVQRVYFVLNSTSLKRVADGISIPTFSMSMSLDVDSWTWSFSAAVPLMAQADVEPTGDGPVEVEADINGVAYRFLVESLSRERAFGSNSLRLSGRGKSALLDAPYSPTFNFGNAIDRTAQQLMADVLTLNGVPLDWTVNWSPTDWLVPANVFSYQGSYIGALNAIAQSCGGYLQPANSTQELSVLLRYPVAPWNWASDVTPDYELPSAVTLRA